jgi:hypothetical protein
MPPDSNISTPQFSEHAPYLLGDRLLFAAQISVSVRQGFPAPEPEQGDVRRWPAAGTEAATNWCHSMKKAVILRTQRSTPGGDVVYYSNCEFIGKGDEVNCGIYRRKLLPGGGAGDRQSDYPTTLIWPDTPIRNLR